MLCHPTGPKPAAVYILGEAPGAEEEARGEPFVGESGRLLDQLLAEASIARSACRIGNVFQERPPGNKLDAWCVATKDYKLMQGPPATPLSKGRYMHPAKLQQMQQALLDIETTQPNIIIALGNTACWALLGTTGITSIRGRLMPSAYGKVLPTYHPAAIMRQWPLRIITVIDLQKAKRESAHGALIYPRRQIHILNSVEDFPHYDAMLYKAKLLAIDIETKPSAGQITSIGFAPSSDLAVVVPLWGAPHHWPSHAAERTAWAYIRRWCESPVPKLMHNGIYDMQWLYSCKIRVRNAIHDSMIAHHALQPELPKSLDFLGSVFTNERPWKKMRPRGGKSNKREE